MPETRITAPAPVFRIREKDGSLVALDREGWRRRIATACEGLDGVSADRVLEAALCDIYDGAGASERDQAAVFAARSLIDKEPNYTYVSARLLLDGLYAGARALVLGSVGLPEETDPYDSYFPAYIRRGIELELLDPRLATFDLPRMAAALRGERDRQFTLLGLQTLTDRYLLRAGDVRFELPQALFLRVAMGLGNDWTRVRALNARIKGTNGASQGVIPFLKIANDTAVAVNQGGKRLGAVCAYMEVWHLDFEEFLELRKNTGDERRRTHDMHTAAWVPDLFMRRVADETMEIVAYHAISASVELAVERGAYPSYQGSLWSRGLLPQDTLGLLEEERGMPLEVDRGSRLDWSGLRRRLQHAGMRNSNVLAIAPTATISNICGVTQSIEPTFQNLYVKSNMSGNFTVMNERLVRDLKAAGIWDEELAAELKYHEGNPRQITRIPEELRALYATAFEIDAEWLVRAAALRQKWIDQSQSLNLYMEEPDGRRLHALFEMAWRSGLKTTYYLRSRAATHVERSTLNGVDRRLNAVEVPESPACGLDAADCEVCQ